jgi:hypothetical protein
MRAQNRVGNYVDVLDRHGFDLCEVAAEVTDHVSAFEIIGQAFQRLAALAFRAGTFFHYADFAKPAENLSLSRHGFPRFSPDSKKHCGECGNSGLSVPNQSMLTKAPNQNKTRT